MFWVLVFTLVVVWIVAVINAYTLKGFIHVLLLSALALLAIQIFQG